MSYFAKKRLSYYKDYKSDIWGLIRNNLQYKIDRTSYNINNIFFEAKRAFRQGFLKKRYYKRNKFIVINTVPRFIRTRKYWNYFQFIHENKIKSFLYFYLLFYFFKTKIKNRLYNIYKVYFSNKKYFWKKKYYYTPFIYEPRIYNVIYKRLKKGALYLTLQLVRLFYIIYSYKQLKKLIKKAKRSDGALDNNFISLMECKLPSFIYRSSFFSNMFECINFIKTGSLLINYQVSDNLYKVIKVMDFVTYITYVKGFIFWTFFKRIRRKAFLFLFPKYMFISLIFILIILIRLPLNKEIINPVAIDMYRTFHYN
jgi:ribosomal protein S4